MTFYKNCLGGKLTLQPIGESTMADKMPIEIRDNIMHSILENEKLVLMASDMCPESGRTLGNAVSLILMCTSEKEIRESYQQLAEGGIATHPLDVTFWGALFGGLTDKYGNNWLFNYNRSLQ
jgi:PhnB protein